MTELANGVCKFKIIQDISKKTGNPYKYIKVTIGDYDVRNWILLNDDQYELIKIKSQMKSENK